MLIWMIEGVYICIYKYINKEMNNKKNIFEFSLKSWHRKVVSELILDTGKALKYWFEGVYMYV